MVEEEDDAVAHLNLRKSPEVQKLYHLVKLNFNLSPPCDNLTTSERRQSFGQVK